MAGAEQQRGSHTAIDSARHRHHNSCHNSSDSDQYLPIHTTELSTVTCLVCKSSQLLIVSVPKICCNFASDRVSITRTAPSDFPKSSAICFDGILPNSASRRASRCSSGNFSRAVKHADFFLISRKRLAGGSHARHEHVDQTRPAGTVRHAAAGVHRNLTAGVAFLAAKELAMGIDNSPLGHLAQPTKRIALRLNRLRPAIVMLRPKLLETNRPAQFCCARRPQPTIDKRHQLRLAQHDKLGQCLAIAGSHTDSPAAFIVRQLIVVRA